MRCPAAPQFRLNQVTVAKEAAGGSEQQGVLDGNQGHATFMAPVLLVEKDRC
jgi:hypothetical protein